jgi:serine/threonine protein kinase
MGLTRGNLRFYELLCHLRVDDVITSQNILNATKWTARSLQTYVNRNKPSRFLMRLPDGRFRVLRAGPALSEQEVERALTQVSPPILVLSEGQVFGGQKANYRLSREIGRGAVGHVWEAESTRSGESVAIKVLNPRPDLLEPTRISEVRRRFRREIQNGDKLRHDHVVEHRDFGEFTGQPFLVMARALRSWADVLGTQGPVDRSTVADIIRHALLGLEHIHSTVSSAFTETSSRPIC